MRKLAGRLKAVKLSKAPDKTTTKMFSAIFTPNQLHG